MKISEVDAKVIEAINAAKVRLLQATGGRASDISVELRRGFDDLVKWQVCLFVENCRQLGAQGDDLEEVIATVCEKHAKLDAVKQSKVARLQRMAEKLGVKVEVLP